MFELELLYEQLKIQTTESEYAHVMNNVLEDCVDVLEFEQRINETVQAIQEVSNEGKMNMFDKFKTQLASAEKILKANKDAALKCKPIGLQHKGFMEFLPESEIKSRYKKALAYMNKFDPNKASEEELKKFLEDSKNNVQFDEISRIYGDGKERYSSADIVVVSKKDKELTKKDIADAIKFLETYKSTITTLQREANEDWMKFSNYINSNAAKKASGKNKLLKNALEHQASLKAIVSQSYFNFTTVMMKMQFKQAKQIVVKAAYYNPRNLKESAMIQDYIDSLYEFSEE